MFLRFLRCCLFFAFVLGWTSPAVADEPPLLDSWGTVGSGPGEWTGPVRFAAYPDFWDVNHFVLVADPASGRVQRYDEGGTFLGEWTAAQNGLVEPVSVAWAPGWTQPEEDDRVLVLDAGEDAVLVYDVDGNLLRSIDLPAFGDGDLAYDEESAEIHVLLTDRHVLDTYGWFGNFQQRRGVLDGAGTGAEQFDSPLSVAVQFGSGLLVVADTGNDRIQLLNPSSLPSDVFGSTGSGPGEFVEPRAVAFDCRGRVLVADTGNDRVQRVLTGVNSFLGLDEIWFAPPDGGLSELVDVGYPLAQVTVVGKEPATEEKRRLGGGDLFLLDAGTGTMRRFEAVCCSGFSWEPPVNVTTAGGSLYITPAGTGPTLEEVGATVTVEIFDNCEEPIAGYPFQDIWLDDVGNGDIALCQDGSTADGNTDAEGLTTISRAIAGGGATDQGLQLYVSGTPALDLPLDIRLSSPDLNGDLKIDLADVGPFGVDFFARVATLRSDFTLDGTLDLSDVGILGQHLGEECP